jgi:preprotein translocase subunit SecA
MTILKLTPEMAAPVEAEAPREMQLRGADEGIQQFAGSSSTSSFQGEGREGSQEPQKPIINQNITGRNDPCPCGSGKKFKKCHGA